MEPKEQPIAVAEMLIRKPVAEVFEAFVDPAITTRFWFTKGSDRLAPGKQIRWEWEMYDISVDVIVKLNLVRDRHPDLWRVHLAAPARE